MKFLETLPDSIFESLPPAFNIESITVLKAVNRANKALAELKGLTKTIPNSLVLLNNLSLREAQDSSAIENIITTTDKVYQAGILDVKDINAKEVQKYKKALYYGFAQVKRDKVLRTSDIENIQKIIEENDAGIRTQQGTTLKNNATGQVIYTPPQIHSTIVALLSNLEAYINEESDVDPLIKLAIIHYQFEKIHPFFDGNGRTGRIINVLYLVLHDLLEQPILYLSRYIIKHKQKYYSMFENIKLENKWEEWVLFIIKGVEETAEDTIDTILGIKDLMLEIKVLLKEKLGRRYSKDLLEILFSQPYTKIDILADELSINRRTASKLLKEIVQIGILGEISLGQHKYFMNLKLMKLLSKNGF